MTTSRPTPGEPSDLDALVALARREHRTGRLAEAAAAWRQILALRPDVAEAHNGLGTILAQQGQLDEAATRFEHAVALRPELAELHYNLGRVLAQQGRLDQAAGRFQQAVALQPKHAGAHNGLASVLWNLGQLERAAAHYQQAIALRPDSAEAHNHLGSLLAQQGKLDEAVGRLQQAIALRPNYAAAHNNLGSVFWNLGQLDRAAAHYRQALTLEPNLADAQNNLGNVLSQQGQLDEALGRFERAIALRPDYAEAHNNLGAVLWKQLKPAQAAKHFERALTLKPDYAEAYSNLGRVLLDQGLIDQAAARCQQAIDLRPDYPDAQLGLAACRLLQGDFRRGWPAYETRLKLPGVLPKLSLPRWTGEPLAGRRLLLVAEQGFGDTFQFLRYVRVLKHEGAQIVLVVQKPLVRLLASHPDVDQLVLLAEPATWPDCDFYLPLLSAPAALDTELENIPRDVPYLWANPDLTARWRQELAEIEGFKIGIGWQCLRNFPSDEERAIPLSQFGPLAGLPGVRLISLQKGFGSEQIATVDFPVLDFSDRLDEAAGAFLDTAALMGSLDLVVTSDTAIAHLAGALGAPVWLALQFSPNWRWLLTRDDSPWYPTMRLFRQTARGQWPDVFERIAQAVQQLRAASA